MRLPVAASAITLAGCVAAQHTVVTVTTRSEVTVGRTASTTARFTTARQTVVLAPSTHDRLEPAALAGLAAHGRWEESVAYGRVWIPFEAYEGGFVPYLTRGEWVASAEGWYWQSGYVWGQIPFHYGRWVPWEGVWAWVPGSVFAPAWVEWRVGNGWVGWSPLAPLGAERAAPFVYCNGHALEGPGLQARTVTGAAAIALFAVTSPRHGGPPLPAHGLPEALPRLAHAPTETTESPGTGLLFEASRSFGEEGPPTALDPIPRARVEAGGARDLAVGEASRVPVLRNGAGGGTLQRRDGARGVQGGYSVVPALREAARPEPLPHGTFSASAVPSPTPRWERAVATPPPASDEAFPPALLSWGRWSTRQGVVEGVSVPRAQPSPEAMGGLGPGRSTEPLAVPAPWRATAQGSAFAPPVTQGGPPSGQVDVAPYAHALP